MNNIIKLIKNYFKLEWMETPFEFFLFKIITPILILIQFILLLYCIWGAITGKTPPSDSGGGFIQPVIIIQ